MVRGLMELLYSHGEVVVLSFGMPLVLILLLNLIPLQLMRVAELWLT
jgi:hypothetical protein